MGWKIFLEPVRIILESAMARSAIPPVLAVPPPDGVAAVVALLAMLLIHPHLPQAVILLAQHVYFVLTLEDQVRKVEAIVMKCTGRPAAMS